MNYCIEYLEACSCSLEENHIGNHLCSCKGEWIGSDRDGTAKPVIHPQGIDYRRAFGIDLPSRAEQLAIIDVESTEIKGELGTTSN